MIEWRRIAAAKLAASVLPVCAMLGFFTAMPAQAEPYFAMMTGQKCVACHVNVTGGGKRTDYGNAFAQEHLPVRQGEDDFWNGRITDYLRVGGNLRATASANFTPNQDDDFGLEMEEAIVYLELPVLEDRITLYLDQQISPGTTSREAWLMLHFAQRQAYLKAGKMFLPFGWRLEDDSEFVRQVSGINYFAPDDGLEAGVELGQTSLRLAITNGTAGGSEVDRGKQWSLHAAHTRNLWRVGGSVNYNDAGAEARTMLALFAGVRLGSVSLMGEVDFIEDDALGGTGREQATAFAEANWWVSRGHNLKLTYGWFEPDDSVDEDERARYSFVYEYFPYPFLQFRAGVRVNDGIPQNDVQNREEVFLQLHGFF